MTVLRSVIILIFSCFGLYGQVVSGVVVDDDGFVLNDVKIKDTLTKVEVYSTDNGAFSIHLELNSVVQISLQGYDTQYRLFGELSDTIRLSKNARILNSITVHSDAVKTILDSPGVNVIDYFVSTQFLVILYKEKSRKFLSVETIDGEREIFPLGRLDGKSLYEDCFGSLHVLTNQKAYRLSLEEGVKFVAETEINQFKNLVMPCEAAIGKTLMISSFSNHAKKYTLAIKKTPEKQFTPFYTIWDHKMEEMATGLYWEVVGLYIANSDTVSDIIKNKMWDGENLRELIITPEIHERVSFYEGVLAQDLNVHSFQVEDQLFTFDLCFDSLFVFDKVGKCIKKANISERKNKNGETVIMDPLTHQFYILNSLKGVYQLSLIDLNDGGLKESFLLSESTSAENVKVFHGWVYFLVGQNGFNKLYKMRM